MSQWMFCRGKGQCRQVVGLVPWQYLQEPGKGADGCCEAQWLDERGLVGLRLPLQLICSVIQGTGRGWQGWGHSAREDIHSFC